MFIAKTSIMWLRKKPKNKLNLYGTIIPNLDSLVYLGVTFDRSHNLQEHLHKKLAKSYSSLILLKRFKDMPTSTT